MVAADDEAVLAGGFRTVESFVGLAIGALVRGDFTVQLYAADAERHFVFGAVLVGERHAAFYDAGASDGQTLIVDASVYADGELVAAQASDQVLRPERGRQRRGRLLQRSIAGKVAVRIVHALEVVGVHHQHGSGGAV